MKQNLFDKIPAIIMITLLLITVISCRKANEGFDPNNQPVASFTITPTSGTTLTLFEFNASGSSDEENGNSTLEVRWDWENDGSWDTDWSANKIASHQFTIVGDYTVVVEVRDSRGLKDTTAHDVIIDNRGTFTDPRDNQTYKTIVIGDQTWFAENLKYETENSYCYNNDLINCLVYGKLYKWDAAMSACPPGWHLPDANEWCTMVQYIDPTVDCVSNGWTGTDIGYKLKSNSGWQESGNGSNIFEFTALPAGYKRHPNGSFIDLGSGAHFWTSTPELKDSYAWRWMLESDNEDIHFDYDNGSNAYSVRCIKD